MGEPTGLVEYWLDDLYGDMLNNEDFLKVLIITFGSRGDVQLYVALGKGLQTAGHSVSICTANRFESFITKHNLTYGYMTYEFLKILDTDMGRDVIESSSGISGVIRSIFKLIKYIKPLAKEMISDSWKAAKAAKPITICPFMADQPFWGECIPMYKFFRKLSLLIKTLLKKNIPNFKSGTSRSN